MQERGMAKEPVKNGPKDCEAIKTAEPKGSAVLALSKLFRRFKG